MPRWISTRLAAAWVVVLVAAACLWWGIHPPRTEEAYRSESAGTVELLRSHVGTADLWLRSFGDGRVTAPAASVALREAETDADHAASAYASYQPPSAQARELRVRVTALADRVVTELGTIRVAAEAGRWRDAVAARTTLRSLLKELRSLHRELAP